MTNKKPWLLLLLFAASVSGLAYFVQFKEKNEVVHIHHHAGFKVYINDELQDYTDFQYMSLSPCNVGKQKQTPEELQMEKAHLHDQIGDVVHVHTQGATWGDLFENLNVSFDKDAELKAYNKQRMIEDILDTQIEPYQSIIIVVGDQGNSNEYIKGLVDRQHIEEIEQKSELCST